VHHLARRVICHGYEASPINISATSHVDDVVTHAPDIAESPAVTGLREVHEAWAARLPNDSDAMSEVLLALSQTDLIGLLAVCVASTVGAIQSRESELPASLLARALDLDMHAWWTPTAAGYFEHVSKAKALEAVGVFAPDQLTRLAKLKKSDLASEAGRLAVGSGWLPAMLCARAAPVRIEDASADDTSVDDEEHESAPQAA